MTKMGDSAAAAIANVQTKFEAAFVKQGWSAPDGSPVDGACQRVDRYGSLAMLNVMRRITSGTNETGRKMRETRIPCGDHWGFKCPTETPDDDKIGLHLALAASCRVSSECSPEEWLPEPTEACRTGSWILVVDGTPHGWLSDDAATRYIRQVKTFGKVFIKSFYQN